MPHGHCFLWEPTVLGTLVVSDIAIGLAYLTIPFALLYFYQRRKDIQSQGVYLLFSLFISACGIGHIVDVFNIWRADYYLSALVRAVTTLVSVATAVFLWIKMHSFIAIPSLKQLQDEVNHRRMTEKQLRSLHLTLDEKVKERTSELQVFNAIAVEREERIIELKQMINELRAKREPFIS